MKNLKNYIVFFITLFAVTNLQGQGLETVKAIPANDFLKSIGVNSAISGRGENINSTITCIEYLGARYIRSGVPGGDLRLAHQKRLYDECNVRFSISLPTNGDASGTYPGGIPLVVEGSKEILAKIAPDAIIAFEGCNEPNNWGNFYQGEIGGGSYRGSAGMHSWKPLARYHRDFYKAVREVEAFDDIPVWSATDVGAAWENVGMHFLEIPEGAVGVDPEFPAGTKFADVACVHNYLTNPNSNNQVWNVSGINGNNSLMANFGTTWRDKYQGHTTEQLEKLRRATTETGTTINAPAVTEEYQGRIYTTCYLSQFARGFEYTAMYILRDRIDEGGNQTFGFYAPGYKPRLAAHFLHNMTTVLKDDVSIENPGTLTYGLSSRPVTLHELLFQKNDGTMMLVIWGEKFARGATADNVTVTFGETHKKINVYNPIQYNENDPTIGKRPVATYDDVSSIDLAVFNHPFIIEIDPKTTSINDVEDNGKSVVLVTNPVEDEIYIASPEKIKQLQLVDLTGKLVMQQGNVESGILNVSSLPKGNYILQVEKNNGTTETHKIIKM